MSRMALMRLNSCTMTNELRISVSFFFAEAVEDSKPAEEFSDAGEENQANDQ